MSPTFPQLLAVESGDLTPDLPEARPGELGGVGLGGVLGRDIKGMALTFLAPSEVEIGAMPAGRIGMARAGGLAAGACGGGEAALDHGLGGVSEFFEERFPTHL